MEIAYGRPCPFCMRAKIKEVNYEEGQFICETRSINIFDRSEPPKVSKSFKRHNIGDGLAASGKSIRGGILGAIEFELEPLDNEFGKVMP